MQQKPLRSPVHWLYAFLLMCAAGCALWQHGHTWFTLGTIAAIPFTALLVYVPYQWYSSLARAIVNGLYGGLVVAWACWRLQTELPDKVLAESLTALCLIFLTTGKNKDYAYLFFSSIFLIIYGALVPRMAFLYIAIPGIILLLLLLWERKSTSVAGTAVHRIFPRKITRIIPLILLQLVLTGCLFWLILPLMPLRNNEMPGLFETSFTTEKESALPPEIQNWITPKKAKVSPDPKIKATTDQGNQKPLAAGEKGKPTDLKNAQSKSLIEGNGSAQGTDLLFYVRTPVKVYHTVKIYDLYDGRTWRVSPAFQRIRLRGDADNSVVRHNFDMKYTMVKQISKSLPFGFMPFSFFTSDGNYRKPNIISHAYGAELRDSPELPFEYAVSVQMNIISMDKIQNDLIKPLQKGQKKITDPLWLERIHPNHYKVLPRKIISKRVKTLAEELTRNSTTYYGKAIALRDHLRNTYSYTLHAQPVPAGKEATDYFLFELKTGHCEYFACALAVLARAAGLPARVVTGFSPGNFNTLNNMVEICENHAHAWTQIYIPHAGWLTMDATPPSSLSSETLPKGLGYLRDPFGDEWKITPPEMTGSTREFLQQDLEKNLMKRKSEENPVDSALVELVNKQEEIKDSVSRKYDETKAKIRKSEKKGGLLYKLKQIYKRCSAFFVKLYFRIADFVFSAWLLLISVLVFIIIFCIFIKTALFEIIRQLKRRKMERVAAHADCIIETDPRLAILEYYQAFRLGLQYTGVIRPQTRELLDFSDDLGHISQTLGNHARWLFVLYYKAKFRDAGVSADDATSASEHYQKAQKRLFELYSGLK